MATRTRIRFKNAWLQSVYEKTLAAAEAGSVGLVIDGKSHRGNSFACAFDDGVKGKRTVHSHGLGAGTAYFAAGAEWAKRHGVAKEASSARTRAG